MGRQIVLDEESSVPQTDQVAISMDTDKLVETPIQIENVTKPRRSGRLEAMKFEIDSMSENQVWDLVDPPEAMLKSIRIMLAIAAHYDYEVWQMDVKTAFHNGYIEEDILMDQPRGFESKDKSKVCKLKRSVYGLK
ncbi:hypothetical protein CRG98_018913 [Punica granatum]|uniref:Reverse transcriptase Ty1/copia-type domain-containing protein n=1 Tax=Punica granatum TaxID=22663 RepID=A0A2I0JYZ3_PUNGR|nr:hypothetical protein CRG98_018913 [Punica granatum]